jgi:hypothetical protein
VPNPVTYASPRQFIGFAIETVQGTPVAPVQSMPVEKFDPEDKWVWLDDKALRGSMTEPYNRVQGPGQSEFSFSGPCYFDTLPYLLSNILGDVSYSGAYTGSGTTTLSSSSIVGATTISTALSIAATTKIQIDVGNLSEVRIVSSVTGSGPFSLTLNAPLTYAHASAVVVKPIQAPFVDTFSVLNSGTAQPSSLTITDWQGPTATTAARAYPGCCLSELTIKGTAESSTLMIDAKGVGWPSVPAGAAPTPILTNALPQAAWQGQIGLNGTVGGSPVKTVMDFEIAIKREVEPIYTAQNSSAPYFIQRGKVTVGGKYSIVAADETSLTYLNNNTQPQTQLIVSNGLAGAALLSMQIDVLSAAYQSSKINRGKAAVGYDVTWDAIANTTNVGPSAGYGPIVISTSNAIVPSPTPF